MAGLNAMRGGHFWNDVPSPLGNNIKIGQFRLMGPIWTIIEIFILFLNCDYTVYSLRRPISRQSALTNRNADSQSVHRSKRATLERPVKNSQTEWNLGRYAFSLLPLAPGGDRRKTLFSEVVKGTIWS